MVLYDRDSARAEGEAWDIADTIPLLAEMEILPSADYAALGGSAAVVITVGATSAADESRLTVLGTNAAIVAGVMRELDRVCPEAVVILVSNPVDVLTRIAIEASSRPAQLIIGSGTVLDGARLRQRLGQLLGVEKEDVHVYVIGEHGDSAFPVWSTATVGASRLEDCPLPESRPLAQLEDELTTFTRVRHVDIHERKGHASYGVAAAVPRIVRAVVREARRIFMVSVRPTRRTRIGDVVLSVPWVIGRVGVNRRCSCGCREDEQRRSSARRRCSTLRTASLPG